MELAGQPELGDVLQVVRPHECARARSAVLGRDERAGGVTGVDYDAEGFLAAVGLAEPFAFGCASGRPLAMRRTMIPRAPRPTISPPSRE